MLNKLRTIEARVNERLDVQSAAVYIALNPEVEAVRLNDGIVVGRQPIFLPEAQTEEQHATNVSAVGSNPIREALEDTNGHEGNLSGTPPAG